MPSLQAQMNFGTYEERVDWACQEAAWDWIAINGWPATPQLLFAIKAWAKEVAESKDGNEG
jgi:hypothetical protein